MFSRNCIYICVSIAPNMTLLVQVPLSPRRRFPSAFPTSQSNKLHSLVFSLSELTRSEVRPVPPKPLVWHHTLNLVMVSMVVALLHHHQSVDSRCLHRRLCCCDKLVVFIYWLVVVVDSLFAIVATHKTSLGT